MTNEELKSFRRLLFLSISEASEHVAEYASPRNWRRMESGKNGISEQIENRILDLVRRRRSAINLLETSPVEYPSYSAFINHVESLSFLDDKIYESAFAHFLAQQIDTESKND